MAANKLRVDIWSDVACPWCLVGKRHFETALRAFPHRDQVTVRFRSFQLDPALPEDPKMNVLDYLEQRKGMPKQQVASAMGRLGDVGKSLDFKFDFENCRTANTRRAHRFIHLARDRGQELPAVEALFKAYFTDGKIISSPETLMGLAKEIGMELESAEELDAAALEAAVAEDIKLARRVGISGVPFFLFDERIAVSGGQPAEVFEQVLGRAWDTKKWPEEPKQAAEDKPEK